MNDRFSADESPTKAGSGPVRGPWPVDLAHSRPFRIGEVEVRPATREVLSGRRRELLEPRVMEVLVVLAAANGAILSRDDLVTACWQGRAVSDDAISRVISRLRSVARAVGGFQVETITKVGYRLVEEGSSERATRGLWNRRLALAGGAAAVAAAGGAAWLASRPGAPKQDPETANLIAEARAAVRDGLPDDMARAAALYRLAAERDPDSAEAWGGLAAVYRFQWEFSPPEEAPSMAARARSAANRALELDPDNGDAHAALAGLVPMFGNWAKAEAEMRGVLARHPQKIRIRAGRLLADTGRLEEALGLVAKAVAEQPDVPRARNFHARLLQDTARPEQAERALTAALARWPRHLLLWFSRFYFLAFSGRPQSALAFAAERSGRPVGVPDKVFDIAFASARALASRSPGDIDRAARLHLEAVPDGAAYAENAVTFLAATEQLDQAFEVLAAYFFGQGPTISESRYGHETATYTPKNNRQTYFLFYRPSAPLRADPRFAELVRDIGLEDYWRETGTVPDFRRIA